MRAGYWFQNIPLQTLFLLFICKANRQSLVSLSTRTMTKECNSKQQKELKDIVDEHHHGQAHLTPSGSALNPSC